MSSTPRFFVPPGAILGDTITLPPDAAHHARNVLRLREGDGLIAHDGAGVAYHATVAGAVGSKNTPLLAHITRRETLHTEPTTRITVAQALPKTGEKIEQVLQHGTEIGAAGFVFWTGFRSVARLADGEKVDKRLIRWRGIVQSAAEQSGRGVLPGVDWQPFAPDIARLVPNYDAAFILHESAITPLRDALAALPAGSNHLLVIVGPEGGLTDSEVETLAASGATPVTLGPRVLRTETAALVALTQMLVLRGE